MKFLDLHTPCTAMCNEVGMHTYCMPFGSSMRQDILLHLREQYQLEVKSSPLKRPYSNVSSRHCAPRSSLHTARALLKATEGLTCVGIKPPSGGSGAEDRVSDLEKEQWTLRKNCPIIRVMVMFLVQ